MFGTGSGKGIDLRLFRTPVRLEISFVVVVALLGPLFVPAPLRSWTGAGYLAAWIVLVTVGVIIHEFGHVVALRGFGSSSRVVLAWIGGATIADPADDHRRLRGIPSIVVSLSGPAAGMSLAFLVDAAIATPDARFELWLRHYSWFVNFWWSIFNLLPILPLDGGHVIRELMEMASKRHGRTLAAATSIAIICSATWLIHRRGYSTIVLFAVAAGLVAVNMAFMTITPRQRRRQDLDDAHQMILDGDISEGTRLILDALGTVDDELVTVEAYTVTGWALLDEGRLAELAWLDTMRFHPAHQPLLNGAVVWYRGRVGEAADIVAGALGNGSVDPPPSYFRRTFGRLGEMDALSRSIQRLPPSERARAFERLRAALSVATG